MSRVVVVSNRGPLAFRAGPDGGLVGVPAAGGLASSLHRLLEGSGTTWASVTMGAADREAVARGLMAEDGLDLVPVLLDDDTYRQAYDVIANTTLWYCHHHLFDLPRRPRFDRHWREAWEGYRRYNRAMADAVAARAGEGDAVLVQDYHFSLLGRMLAERRPDLRAVHFLHTPFADPGMLAVLPDDVVAEILDGMAGYRACGLHAHMWESSFVGCYAAAGLRPPRTFVSPLGPDADVLAVEAAAADCAAAAEKLQAEVGRRRTIVRSDRMEPSKNIVRGMLAFEELLTAHPEWRGEVVHVALAYPSRQGLAEYLAYGAEVVHTAERINHSLVGSGGARVGSRPHSEEWTPIVLHVEDDRARALAALTTSDVLLVNPVRDGLNLVAKEGPLLNAADGVLVLSHEAGAWEELSLSGGGAIGVNPFDVSATAEALHTALSLPAAERKRRAAAVRAAVRARTSADWWADQIAAAASDGFAGGVGGERGVGGDQA
jgi:trehalose 6-phosphate synthase